jgi:hypothetical protein
MKGGWVKGAVYGTASISNTRGSRCLVFTGGEVNGWVAGGCNGTDFSAGDGINNCTCYICAGGRTQLRSHDGNGTYNNAYGLVFNIPGGQIFGAGRGLAPVTNSNVKYCGSTTTSYVAVADECQVEQNVYGGGYNGVSNNSHVYILGGTIGKKVFGGTARAVSEDAGWRCNNTDIRMYGGTVLGGIYGGHDETGIQYQNASVKITGGTVGQPGQLGFVFGGGLGSATSVRRNVTVQIGEGCNATSGATIYGDVYGGSAEGFVNGTAANNTYSTNVTLYKGTIYGGLYGGGYGCAAFAFALSDAAFGDAPATKHYNASQIRVGDILRVEDDTHMVIVLSVSNSGLVVAEGNYNDSIHWGRKISPKELHETLDYVITRY